MEPPVLTAYRVGQGTEVWCDHEKLWHFHSKVGDTDEHRIAHCRCPESPYKQTGYMLRGTNERQPEMTRTKKRVRCECGHLYRR